MVVDTTGVRRGRKSLTWPTVESVVITASADRVKLTSSTGQKLFVPRDNVRDLPMARA